MRRDWRGVLARCWWLPAALSALSALVFFKDFGVGWDDPLQARYGDLLLSYYSSGGIDESYAELADLRYYGGAFEMPAQLLARISPWTPIETRRLAGGLVGALGVLGCGALGGLMGGVCVAWLSGALLASWPSWVGHSFVNSKDIPFAAAFVWAIYFLVRIARADPAPRRADQAGFAFSSGLAIGTRAFGLVLLFVYAGLFARVLARAWRGPDLGRRRRVALQGLPFTATAVTSWLIMMIAWPWTQRGPFSRPFEAAQLMSRFPRPMEVLFKGQLTVTTRLPWDYVPTWLGSTLPPLVVILLLLLLPMALLRLRDGSRRPGAAEGILLFLACGPLFAAITGRVVLYDGIRQLLFVIPLLMVVSSWVAVEILGRSKSRRWRGSVILVALLLSLDPLAGLVRLHPYQYAYFNRLVGGLRGAAPRFETDYWGLALREAAEWVSQNQRLLKSRGVLKVFVPHNCAEPTSAGAYLDPAVRLTDNNLAANYVLAPTRFGCEQRFLGTTVFKVQREGAVLAVVKVME